MGLAQHFHQLHLLQRHVCGEWCELHLPRLCAERIGLWHTNDNCSCSLWSCCSTSQPVNSCWQWASNNQLGCSFYRWWNTNLGLQGGTVHQQLHMDSSLGKCRTWHIVCGHRSHEWHAVLLPRLGSHGIWCQCNEHRNSVAACHSFGAHFVCCGN